MAFLLQLRQADFDLRPVDVAKRHRAKGREDVPFELEAVDVGRHNTQLERTFALKTNAENASWIRPAGTLP